MGADSNIFQQFAQPVRSVADYMGDADMRDLRRAQLQGATQNNAMQALTMDQSRQTMADTQRKQNALREAAQAAGPNADPVQFANNLMRNPDTMDAGVALQKHLADTGKVQADTDKSRADTGKTTWETQQARRQASIQHLASLETPELAIASINGDSNLSMQERQQLVDSMPRDMVGFMRWQLRGVSKLATPEKQADLMKPNLVSVNNGKTTSFVDTNAITNPGGPAPITMTTTPGEDLTAATAKAGQAVTARGQNIVAQTAREGHAIQAATAGLNPDGTEREGSGLSEQAREAAAARYRIDGTLPTNMGRGQQGPKDVRDILNRAAKQAAESGDTPEAQRIGQIINKANTQALGKLQTQQTMVGAFEKNFNKNADLAEQLSDQFDRTGIPLVNKWVNAGKRAITGDPAISAFDANLKATVNEYAKIVSGGTGNTATAQGEIAKIEGLLSAAQTAQQVKAVINIMRKETANRMTAFDEEKSALTASMVKPKVGGTPAAPTGGAPPAKTGSGATVSKW